MSYSAAPSITFSLVFFLNLLSLFLQLFKKEMTGLEKFNWIKPICAIQNEIAIHTDNSCLISRNLNGSVVRKTIFFSSSSSSNTATT